MQANYKNYAESGVMTCSLNSNKSSKFNSKHVVQPIHVRGNKYNNVPYDYDKLERQYETTNETHTEITKCPTEKFIIISKVLRNRIRSISVKEIAKFYYGHHKMINATPTKHLKHNLQIYFDTPNLTNTKFNILIGKKPSTPPTKSTPSSLKNGLYIKYRNNRIQPVHHPNPTLGQTISNIKSIIFVNLSKTLNLSKHYFNQINPNINQVRAILNTIPMWIHPQSILSNSNNVIQEYRNILNKLISQHKATHQQITNFSKSAPKQSKINFKTNFDTPKTLQNSVHITLTFDSADITQQILNFDRRNDYGVVPKITDELLYDIIKQHCTNPIISNQQQIDKANKMNSTIRYHNIKQHKSEPLIPVPSPKYVVYISNKWPEFESLPITTSSISLLTTHGFDKQDTFTTNDRANIKFLRFTDITSLRSINSPRAIDNKHTIFIDDPCSTLPQTSCSSSISSFKPIQFISSSTSKFYDNQILQQPKSCNPVPVPSSIPSSSPSTINNPKIQHIKPIPASKTVFSSIADYFSNRGSTVDASQELD